MKKAGLFLLLFLWPSVALAESRFEQAGKCLDSFYRLKESPDCPIVLELPKNIVIWTLTDGANSVAEAKTKLRKGYKIPGIPARLRTTQVPSFEVGAPKSHSVVVLEFNF